VQTIDLRNDSWTATKASSSSFWVPRSPAHFFLVSQWSAKECDFRPGMVSYDGMLWYGKLCITGDQEPRVRAWPLSTGAGHGGPTIVNVCGTHIRPLNAGR